MTTSYWAETRPCPKCQHFGHVVGDDVETFKTWYGEVRRLPLDCPHCSCRLPIALLFGVLVKWRRRKDAR
jgi:hypothetical protein